jgi:CubicO group peptidase (beta-lactamase class C family)
VPNSQETGSEVTVEGWTAPGFGGVAEAFAESFRSHGDKGASLGVYVDGELKADLWGGVADPVTGRPWARDSVSIMYSATKGATAILAWLLAQRGALDFDAPVTRYWPEFGGGGKAAVPVRYLFTHQAGLPYLDTRLTREEILDGSRIVEVLARQQPAWVPGTAHGYHALTYGWLAGALIAKATGTPLGKLFEAEIAQPLGLDLHIGLPTADIPRVAPLIDMPPPDPAAFGAITDPAQRELLMALGAAMGDPDSTFSRALSTNGALPTPDATTWNDPRVYQAEMPAANGISNGRSLARLYAATVSEVEGIRLLSGDTVAMARAEQVSGPDRTLIAPTRFGTGFQLPSPAAPLLSPDSFGHAGAGGALGFGDPRRRVGFGYVQNQLLSGGPDGDPRTRGLIAAVERAIGALGGIADGRRLPPEHVVPARPRSLPDRRGHRHGHQRRQAGRHGDRLVHLGLARPAARRDPAREDLDELAGHRGRGGVLRQHPERAAGGTMPHVRHLGRGQVRRRELATRAIRRAGARRDARLARLLS